MSNQYSVPWPFFRFGLSPPPPRGGAGCFGIEWYIIIIIIKYKEKSLDIPNLIWATNILSLGLSSYRGSTAYALKIDQACLIDMARFFAFVWTDTKSRSMTAPTPTSSPKKKKKRNDDDDELYFIWKTLNRQKYILFKISASLKMSQISASIF